MPFKPDKVAYHSLLNACANTSFIQPTLYTSTEDRNDDIMNALHIMTKSYNDVMKKHKYLLNDNHYYVLLEGCHNLIIDKKEKVDVVGKYITQCCNDGYVSISVFNMLRNMRLSLQDNDRRMLQVLLNVVEYNNVPREWSRRVKIK